ncbi:MAG: PAS domain S-box protein [Desulfobacterium sp.]|nr:PAS domain S-box protein [Desulfobacterium sp.]
MDQPTMQKPLTDKEAIFSSASERKNIIILISTVLSVIAILVIVTLFFNKKIILQHEKNFQDQQTTQVLLAKIALEASIKGILKEASILAAHSLPEFASGKRDLKSLRELFIYEQAVYPENLAHVFLDAPGHVIQTQSKSSPPGVEANRLAVEWASEHWAELTVMETGPLIPFFNITQKHQLFGMLFPIRVDESMRGVLAVIVDLKPIIHHYIAPLGSGQYGAGYLIDERGTVVYDNETEIIGKTIFDGMHAQYAELIQVDKRLISEPSGADEYSFTVKRGDRLSRKLIVWNSAVVGDHKLIICLSAPDIEINKTLYGLRMQRIISGIFFAVFLLVISAGFFRIRQQILETSNALLKERINQQTEKLKRNEERLELALKGGDLGLWDWNIQTGQVVSNDRWAEMVGYDIDTIKPNMESWQGLVHPDDKPHIGKKMNAHLEGRRPYFEAEYRIRPKNRDWIWIFTRGKVMDWDIDGKPLRVTGTHIDITKRKQVEQALHESEERYRSVVENSPMGIAIINDDSQYIFANNEFCNMSGYRKEQIIGKPFFFMLTGKSKELAVERFSKRHRGEDVPDFYEFSFIHKNGELRNGQISSVVYKDSKGHTNSLIQVLDITQRKRDEEKIKENDKKYRTLFESSVDAISILDVNTGTFIDCNTAALKVYEIKTRSDFIGLTPARMSPKFQANGKSSQDLAQEYIQTAFMEGSIIFEWLHLNRNGKQFPVMISLSAMLLGDKKLVIAITRDITDRKKTEKEREKLITELQQALEDVKTLSGLLPICSKCKKIRDDKGYWNNLEGYIESHSEVLFSHGLCAECSDILYGKESWYIKAKKKRLDKKLE